MAMNPTFDQRAGNCTRRGKIRLGKGSKLHTQFYYFPTGFEATRLLADSAQGPADFFLIGKKSPAARVTHHSQALTLFLWPCMMVERSLVGPFSDLDDYGSQVRFCIQCKDSLLKFARGTSIRNSGLNAHSP